MTKARAPRSKAELLGDAKPAREHGNSRGPVRGSGAGGRSANPCRDQLYQAQTRIAELKAEQLAGRLVLISDVEEQWAARIVDCRQRLLAVASRVGAKLGLNREQVEVIDSEIRAALTALAAQGGVSDAGDPPRA